MATVKQKNENENESVAPTLGTPSGIIGQGIIPGQTRAVTPRQKGSGRFTNLQSYIRANEPESGGLNPNARFIQQRAEQAGTQLGQRQTEFTKGLEPIKTGLEGIQERASVAQSAFQDPTKFVQSPENLKRFTALRTGQEKIPGVTETYGQVEPLRQGLTSQQRQIAGGLRTDVGQNLQDYIRSQRPNPALATLGEQQLDRFLTEQTPSGLSAIESAVSRAGQIESEQTPAQERLTQLETMRSQLADNPLVTQSGILNRLGEIYRPEEEFITNLNQEQAKNFIAQSLNGTAQSFDENLNELNRNIRKIQQTIAQRDRNIANIPNLPEYRQEVDDLDRMIFADPRAGNERWVQETRLKGMEEIRNKYLNKIDLGRYEGEKYLNEITNNPVAQTLRAYESTVNNLKNLNKKQILQQYDPAKLARIQAIGQLAGREFEDMLGGKLS